MTTRCITLLVAALILSGCGGSADQPAVPAPPTAEAYTPPSEPAYTLPIEQGEYANPAELTEALNAGGFDCSLESDEPGQDIIGSTTQTCWLLGQTDQIRINIYYTSAQQADGVKMLKGNNWQVVEGNLWTVSAMSPKVATEVVEALK